MQEAGKVTRAKRGGLAFETDLPGHFPGIFSHHFAPKSKVRTYRLLAQPSYFPILLRRICLFSRVPDDFES